MVLSFRFPKPLAKTITASVFLFGYRSGRPFAHMPKLQIKVGMFHVSVSDRARRFNPKQVRVIRRPKEIVLRVPLQLLGDPQKILISAHTSSFGGIPLDRGSWRVVDLTA